MKANKLITTKYGKKILVNSIYDEKDKLMKLDWTITHRAWNQEHKGFIVDYTLESLEALENIHCVVNQDLLDPLLKEEEKKAESLKESNAMTSNLDIPVNDGLKYLPFQKAGIEYINKRKSCLLSDDMGIGKTIQAIGLVNLNQDSMNKILIVCPASLKLNWEKELNKWLVKKDYEIQVIFPTDKFKESANIYIINYALLNRHKENFKNYEFDLIIADESHKLKNGKALRSKAFFKIKGKRKLFLSGTPFLNRPVELFTVLKSVGLFTNWLKFVTRYCGAYKDRFGWVVTGSSNLKELQQILRENVMIRRLKKDVLSELPDKIRQTISIQTKSKEMKLIKQEKDLYNDYLNAQNEIRILKQQGLETGVVADKMRLVFSELAKLRHDVAVIKIPFIINFISDALENGNKIVLFAHHKDVTRAVHDAFKEISVTIVGETKSEDRQKAVDKFQNNPDIKLFVGSITACAEGITLTASSNVVFAELAWQPAIMTQSEDRCHRLGQKNSVLVQYITLQNSLDEYMAKMLEHKKEIFAEVMN